MSKLSTVTKTLDRTFGNRTNIIPGGKKGVVAATATFFAVGAAVAGMNGPHAIDTFIYEFLPTDPNRMFRDIGKRFGDADFVGMTAATIAGMTLVRRAGWKPAATAIVGPVAAGVMADVFGKPFFDRTLGVHEALAYPSGHTTGATALALAAIVAAKPGTERHLAVAVGSMVTVWGSWAAGFPGGGHVPTDIIGGWVTAVAAVGAVAMAVNRIGQASYRNNNENSEEVEERELTGVTKN